MTALAVLIGVVVLLPLASGLALAARQRRVDRQPQYPPFQPGPAARRETDRTRHPDDAETQEIPRLEYP